MTATDDIIDRLIERGADGLSDPTAGRSAHSRFGISGDVQSRWFNTTLMRGEVEALGEPEARKIYLQWFIRAPGFDLIHDPRLAEQVIDCGVMHGTERTVAWLAALVPAGAVGKLDVTSAAAVNTADARTLNNRLIARRLEHIAGELIVANRRQAEAAPLWTARALSFLI